MPLTVKGLFPLSVNTALLLKVLQQKLHLICAKILRTLKKLQTLFFTVTLQESLYARGWSIVLTANELLHTNWDIYIRDLPKRS